jgi:hypothetical protein
LLVVRTAIGLVGWRLLGTGTGIKEVDQINETNIAERPVVLSLTYVKQTVSSKVGSSTSFCSTTGEQLTTRYARKPADEEMQSKVKSSRPTSKWALRLYYNFTLLAMVLSNPTSSVALNLTY